MDETNLFAEQRNWRFFDQATARQHEDPLASFAIDDTLCASIGSGQSPATARAWAHDKTVVLGIQDTRLPKLAEGRQFLKEKGFQSIVRNSGGLAVTLDEGVINISLVLSEIDKKIDINRGYDAMLLLIQMMFADFQQEIVAGEIVGSYCPGSYDVSIMGKKFAGISQRRLRGGVAVQAYIAVTNQGQERAELIRQFYEITQASEHPTYTFPVVDPLVTASLAELLTPTLTVADVVARFAATLGQYSRLTYATELTEVERDLFTGYMERVVARNEKAFVTIKE